MTDDDEVGMVAISASDIDDDESIREQMRVVDEVCKVHGP